MKKLIWSAVWIAAFGSALIAQNTNSERVTVSWSDPSRPGLLKVNLLSGAITVRAHTGRDVIIEGTGGATRRGGPAVTPDGLRRLNPTASGLTVEEQSNVISISNMSPFNSGNFDIQVPARTNLSLSTINGSTITVEGVEGELEVSNTNGNVRLTNVAGSVVAHAMNGNLFAVLRELTPNKPMSFTSMNANVDVTLPAAAKANVKMRTNNGDSYSNFDIQGTGAPQATVEDTRSTGGRFRFQADRTVAGTINGGGPEIELRTFNGNVYLRKAN